MLNKHSSFQAFLLKSAEMAFSGCVGHLPAFERMNDGPLQSPLTLHWCWHPSQQFSVSHVHAQIQQTPSAICKCSMLSADGRILQSFILESLFQQSDRFHFWFFFLISPKFYSVTLFDRNIRFLVYMAIHCTGNTHYFHLLMSCVFFSLRTKQTPFLLHFPCFPMMNTPPIFFVCFFLYHF